MAGRLIDVSHAFGDGTVTYPGLPAPEMPGDVGKMARPLRPALGRT